MAISKEFIPHTKLNASDLNELVAQVNAYIAEINATLEAAIASSTSGIERQTAQSEEQAIVYETDGGVQVGKIDANGADFTNLKRGGQQVARMSDLPAVPTLDTSIDSSPSNSHTPSTKAVKDYVDANSGDYPIEKESTQSESEEQVWGNDAETQEYVKIGSYGIKSKAYLDMSGNNVIPVKDTAIGEMPSQANVPTSKAVADYVSAHGGGGTGDLPISKEDTQSDTEEQVWSNNEGTDTYAKINNTGLSAKNINILDDCLVVFNGTQLAIYKNILGTNKYIEYSIVHVYSTDTDPSHVPDNADYWRISTSYVCSRRGSTFTRLYKCLEANENEFVFHIKNAADYTGGYHGDEKYTDIHFFLDGEDLDLTSSFTKKGNHFEFIITSNMYDTLNDITDVVAVHYKRTIITDDGYITQNRVVFQKSTLLNEVFAGLCCVSKEVASKWFAEDLVVHTCVGDSTSTFPTIVSEKPVVCFYNPTNNVMVEVTSEIIYGIEPEILKLSIWDRSGDTKFYYRSPGNTTSLNVSQGDEYKVELTFKLKI